MRTLAKPAAGPSSLQDSMGVRAPAGRADLDLYLVDGQGNFISGSDAEGTVDELLDQTLSAGKYYLVIDAYTDVTTATDYTLTIQ